MTSYRLAASLAFVAFLIAVASARSTNKPERLDVLGRHARAPDDTNASEAVVINANTGLAKWIIAVIVVALIIIVIAVILCCICCCGACIKEEETPTPTVAYSGAPNQQSPPAQQQWPPAAYPGQPHQAYAPPYSPPYAPPCAPPYPANQCPHQRY